MCSEILLFNLPLVGLLQEKHIPINSQNMCPLTYAFSSRESVQCFHCEAELGRFFIGHGPHGDHQSPMPRESEVQCNTQTYAYTHTRTRTHTYTYTHTANLHRKLSLGPETEKLSTLVRGHVTQKPTPYTGGISVSHEVGYRQKASSGGFTQVFSC